MSLPPLVEPAAELSVDEIRRWAPSAQVFTSGSAEEMVANCDELIIRYSTLAYVGLAIATIANMYVVLTTLYPDNPQIQDWLGIGRDLRAQMSVITIALIHLAGFIWVALQLRDSRLARLADEVARLAPDARAHLEHAPRLGRDRQVHVPVVVAAVGYAV